MTQSADANLSGLYLGLVLCWSETTLGSALTGSFRGPWKPPALKARLDMEFRGAGVYTTGPAKTEKGNSGLEELGCTDFVYYFLGC